MRDGDYEITASIMIKGKQHTCTVSGNTDDLEELITQMVALTGVELRLWSFEKLKAAEELNNV